MCVFSFTQKICFTVSAVLTCNAEAVQMCAFSFTQKILLIVSTVPMISFIVMLLIPQIPDEVEGIETDRSHRSFYEDSVVDELDTVQRSRAESRSPKSINQPVYVHASPVQPAMYVFVLLLRMISSIYLYRARSSSCV